MSDPFNNPFGGGNGSSAPDPQNPFQIVNEERPKGGHIPSPFETVAEQSPFGIVPSVEPKPAAAAPRFVEPAPSNPFRTVPKEPEPVAAVGPSRERGFEMTGMRADATPVGNLGTAPLGAGVESQARYAQAAAPAVNQPVFTEAPKAAAERFAPAPAATPARLPAKGAKAVNMKQLELRAIFGVNRELSRSEILQKARSLPGILNLASVSGHNMEALETLRGCMDGLGFAPADAVALSCPDGLIEFISYGNSTLAVLREGDFGPGVRETLIIIARELDQE